METENNMRVLSKLIPEIKDYQSKLILYSYDSFLLDFNMEDGLDYLVKVKDILEQDGKYPVKVVGYKLSRNERYYGEICMIKKILKDWNNRVGGNLNHKKNHIYLN